MVRRFVLGVGVLVFAAVSRSEGQALPTARARIASLAGGVSYSIFQPDFGPTVMRGITGYVDANVSERWGVEMETHRIIFDGSGNMSEISYGVGPRYTVGPNLFRLYGKALIGGAALNYPSVAGRPQGKFFQATFGGGLEVPVSRRFTMRVADFEYQWWPGFSTHALGPYGVSFGGSFRFWRAER